MAVRDEDEQFSDDTPLFPNIRRRRNGTSAARSSYDSNATRATPTTTASFDMFADSPELDKRQRHTEVTRHSILDLIPSLLPQFRLIQRVQTISSSTIDFGYSVFETYTYYRELTQAVTDSEIEVVLRRLMQEWQFVGVSVRSSSLHLRIQSHGANTVCFCVVDWHSCVSVFQCGSSCITI